MNKLEHVRRSRARLRTARAAYQLSIRLARPDHTLEEIATAAGVTKAAIHKTLKGSQP